LTDRIADPFWPSSLFFSQFGELLQFNPYIIRTPPYIGFANPNLLYLASTCDSDLETKKFRAFAGKLGDPVGLKNRTKMPSGRFFSYGEPAYREILFEPWIFDRGSL
jgi:hypothetical protein